jgi:hypothetical protein
LKKCTKLSLFSLAEIGFPAATNISCFVEEMEWASISERTGGGVAQAIRKKYRSAAKVAPEKRGTKRGKLLSQPNVAQNLPKINFSCEGEGRRKLREIEIHG